MDAKARISENRCPNPSSRGWSRRTSWKRTTSPDSMVSEFSSLTTSYCWVITEGAAAGYDGAEPSVVGKSGPGQKVVGDVTEALTAGRFFRLADGQGHELAIGRLYDPSGQNELAPLDDFGRQDLGTEHRIPRRRRLAGCRTGGLRRSA